MRYTVSWGLLISQSYLTRVAGRSLYLGVMVDWAIVPRTWYFCRSFFGDFHGGWSHHSRIHSYLSPMDRILPWEGLSHLRAKVWSISRNLQSQSACWVSLSCWSWWRKIDLRSGWLVWSRWARRAHRKSHFFSSLMVKCKNWPGVG